jgi:hypothetical protein
MDMFCPVATPNVFIIFFSKGLWNGVYIISVIGASWSNVDRVSAEKNQCCLVTGGRRHRQ